MSSVLNRILALLSIFALAWTLTACASEEEKQARRDNAFDLAGSYTATVRAGSALDFVMSINNESGRHDVIANMDRGVALTNQETTFLQNRHGINPGTVSSYFTKNLVLGRGQQNTIEGGENISDDFGESSRVHLCSDSLKYDSQKSVRYCMSGSIHKSDYVLRGRLTLMVSTETKKVDQNGQEYSEVSLDSTDMNFTASTENVYYTQYYGTWNGSVTVNESVGSDTARVSSMTLQKISDVAFQVNSPVSSISLQGQSYTFESRTFATTQLADKTIPLVEMSFRRNDSDRIIFVGEIRSLGNMSGSVIWISGTNRTLIGSFLFKRR